uniref:Glycosyl hydrolase family 98 putative carbohydrate-binding module domain-containing protein n=1 Tax=Eubacterium cellulosolvens (strain ATCC 43171 / JCM 9499 / 6) TaxID=633697 RepID=I5AXD3_EUBC6
MKKTIAKMLCVFLIGLIACCFFTACSSTLEKFEDAFKNGDYDKAIELYVTHIDGDIGEQKVAILFMEEYLSNALKSYASGKGKAITYKNAAYAVEKIERSTKINTDVDTMNERFEKIKKSKFQYKKGKKLLSSGKWVKAMHAFAKIVTDDTENYKDSRKKVDEAEKKYVDSIIEKADMFVKDGDYENAIATVSDATHKLPRRYSKETDPKKIQSITYYGLSSAGKELHDYLDSKTEEWMEISYKSKEYKNIFKTYQAAVNIEGENVPDKINDAYKASITEYLKDVDSRAEEAFGESKDYEAAMQVYKDELADTEELGIDEIKSHLEEKKESYSDYIPINLTTLEYTQKTEYLDVGNDNNSDNNKDVNGKSYNNESIIMPTGGWLAGERASTEDEAYVMYNLNYQYSTLTGVLYRPYTSLSDTHEWKKPTVVKIYGDNQLLYEGPNITNETYDTYDISVDVSGVRNLKIVMMGTWVSEDSGWIGIYDYHPKVCMGEVKLQK